MTPLWILYFSLLTEVLASESDKPVCPAGHDVTTGSGLYWPETYPGTTVVLPCPQRASGDVRRSCVGRERVAYWEKPDVNGCVNSDLQKLWETASNVVDRNSPEADDVAEVLEVVHEMMDAASVNQSLYPQDIESTLDYLYKTAATTDRMFTTTPEESISRLTQAFSDAMSSSCDQATEETWRNFNDPEKVLRNSQSILYTMYVMNHNIVELMANKNSNATRVSAYAKNINVDIIVSDTLNTITTNQLQKPDQAAAMDGNDNPFGLEGISLERSHVMTSESGDTTIIFTEEIINISTQARPLYNGDYKAFSQVEYATLYQLLDIADTHENSSEDDKWTVSGSKVTTAQIVNVDEGLFSNLSVPVVIIFRHNLSSEEGTLNAGCYFINESATSQQYIWSDEGCVVHETNSTHTTCFCYHLTSFALIMDIFRANLSDAHQKALSYISYIGGILSITCCVVVILIYEAFRLQNERIRIHEMLAITIALSQLNFFFGFERTENKCSIHTHLPPWCSLTLDDHFNNVDPCRRDKATLTEAVCKILAITLHYFLSSLFCWMLIEGIHLYQSLVKVFRRNSNFRKYMALGWGLPFLNVLICVLVFLDDYAAGDYCWLSNKLLIIGFVPFLCLTLFANTVVLIVVLRIMFRSIKSRNEDLSTIKTGFKATVILLPLLGLTWVFGFLSAADHNTLVFTYMFTICNSLQGVFFFIFHCVMNKDVQKAFERKYTQHKCSRDHSQQSRDALSTMSHRVVEGDSVRRVVAHSKRSSASSTDSSGTSQTNMDSDFSTKDEYLAVKRDSPDKLDKDWYNISAQVYDGATQSQVDKDSSGLHTCVTAANDSKSKKEKSSGTGRFRQRKRGVVTRQDAMRRKTKSEEVLPDYRDDYLEWTKALEELDNTCNEHMDMENAYTGYI